MSEAGATLGPRMRRKTLAIPIRVTDYSNSSQVVSLFSRESGLVEGIAKGAYRPKSGFQGSFDLAVLREVVYVERRVAGLAILTESSLLDGYRGLRRSWTRHVAASHVLEFLRAVATGGEPACELFDHSEATLSLLSEAPADDLSEGLIHFELRALRILGFLGSIDCCVSCRRPWPGQERAAYFSSRNGGLLCRRCRGAAGAGPATALPGRVVKTLQDLAVRPRTAGRRVERAVLKQLYGLVSESRTFFLERPPKMLKYSPVWL